VALVVVATVTPLPECRAEVLAELEKAAPLIHAEEGCELWALHEAKASFVLVEQWRDPSALKAHGGGPAFTELTAAIGSKLDKPLEVQVLTPRPAGAPALGAVRA
jgi:quinol monooxygenase YgiN